MTIRFATTCLVALAASSALRADGGAVRASGRLGPYSVTVFTSPSPLRAGPVDVSVLVQEAESGAPVDLAPIEIRAILRSENPATLRHSATKQAATNKLLSAAKFNLPAPGTWDIEAAVGEPKEQHVVRFTADVAEPLARWQAFWPWFAWPIIPIGLFLLAQTRPGVQV